MLPLAIYCEMVPETGTILKFTFSGGKHEDRMPSERTHLGLETWQEPSSWSSHPERKHNTSLLQRKRSQYSIVRRKNIGVTARSGRKKRKMRIFWMFKSGTRMNFLCGAPQPARNALGSRGTCGVWCRAASNVVTVKVREDLMWETENRWCRTC